MEPMEAKIDTGADTGAMHCTKIREEMTESGPVLHFSPFDRPERNMTAHHYIVKSVRSSNGMSATRYYIDTTIRIHGEDYPIRLGLANRTEMKYQVLIGKRFLRQHGFVVDVSKKSQ